MFFSSVHAQVPKDAMPVVKPMLTDSAMSQKPAQTGDNMPIANPDAMPSQNENTVASPSGKNRKIKPLALPPKRKK